MRPKVVRPRFRIYRGTDIAIGPGKAELLQAISETGSIHQAAVTLEMSYMRAWKLVRIMNSCFKKPLVLATRGGKHLGGACLTPLGKRILDLYSGLESESLAATAPLWKKIVRELK